MGGWEPPEAGAELIYETERGDSRPGASNHEMDILGMAQDHQIEQSQANVAQSSECHSQRLSVACMNWSRIGGGFRRPRELNACGDPIWNLYNSLRRPQKRAQLHLWPCHALLLADEICSCPVYATRPVAMDPSFKLPIRAWCFAGQSACLVQVTGGESSFPPQPPTTVGPRLFITAESG